MSPVLRLDRFGLAFDARVILRSVSFEVPAQGCTALLGPSGTGKSTLLRTLAGLTLGHPQLRLKGHADYQGQPCAGTNRPALVEQKSQLLVSTVLENLVCEMPERSQLTRAMQIARLNARLERLDQESLLEKLSTQVIDLPVTQQRIIAILRKAMARPALLMVDEPTANLSLQESEPILALLRRLSRERPLLMVTHHLGHTRRIADQVILMADGVVQEQASSELFFKAPQSDAAQHFLRTGSCPEYGVDQGEDFDEAIEAEAPAASPLPLITISDPLPPTAPAASAPVVRPASWGPRGFVWLLPGQVAGTPWPGIVRDTEQDLQALQDVGITRLISLTENPFPAAAAAGYGIRCSASPMPDMHAPTVPQALQLCQDMDRFIAQGDCLAVHCKAGLGRTGTVLGAYWLWCQRGQADGATALTHIRRLESAMVQSREQEEFLDHFAALLRQHFAETETAHGASAFPHP